VGGNIYSLLKLAGTPFAPTFRDSILFLEAFETTPDDCKCQLSQLQQIGAFERIKGVLIGYIWGLQASEKRRMQTQMEDTLKRMTSSYDFPIVKCDDFGHNCPNTTLPVGTRVKLDASEGREPELEILEKCVK
jgi:muramoyltetrapeptide carboxypeptidase